MRTMRLSVAGMVILALLRGLGGVVVAQHGGALAFDVPHQVGGTMKYAGTFARGTNAWGDGRSQQRDFGSRDSIEMHDARLSGTLDQPDWLPEEAIPPDTAL